MMRLRILRGMFAALGCAWLASACVRLNKPEEFKCNTDADCDADQKCIQGAAACFPKEACIDDYDCDATQICESSHCIPAQCTQDDEATACGGFLCIDRRCGTSCYLYSSNCATGFHCSRSNCVPGAPLPNGQKCSEAAECVSGVCCAKPSGSVCTTNCASPSNDSCATATDCASGICCHNGNAPGICSATACAPPPQCTKDADCGSNKYCSNQKCFDANATGALCAEPAQCLSNSCVNAQCRGTRQTNESCTEDVECAAGHTCCPTGSGSKTCSASGGACLVGIGGPCNLNSDCLSGRCIGTAPSFCTTACSTDAQCGSSPWGSANACVQNGGGEFICFPGCTTTAECDTHLSATFTCYPDGSKGQSICEKA